MLTGHLFSETGGLIQSLLKSFRIIGKIFIVGAVNRIEGQNELL